MRMEGTSELKTVEAESRKDLVEERHKKTAVLYGRPICVHKWTDGRDGRLKREVEAETSAAMMAARIYIMGKVMKEGSARLNGDS